MTGFPRTPRPHEKRWCGTHIGRARRHRCRFRAPARADRRSAFQAVPALLRSRRCAVSLRFAGRCWPVAVKMQPRREPQQSRWRRWQGNADLWPVLPVGAGTAARSAAKGEYHPAVRMTLSCTRGSRPRGAPPELGVLPAPQRMSMPSTSKNNGSELRSLPACPGGKCERGAPPPFTKKHPVRIGTRRSAPPAHEGVAIPGAKRRAVREGGSASIKLRYEPPNRTDAPLPDRSTRGGKA